MPFEINGFPSCVFIGAIYCLLLFLLKETSKSQQQAYRYICPPHFNDVFSRCLQKDSAKRPSFSEIKQSLVTQVRLILLLLILDDFWMSFFFLFRRIFTHLWFWSQIQNTGSCDDYVTVFKLCTAHKKWGFSKPRRQRQREPRRSLSSRAMAEQYICSNAN